MRFDCGLVEVTFERSKKPIEVFIDRVRSSAVAEKSESPRCTLSDPLVVHVDATRQRLGRCHALRCLSRPLGHHRIADGAHRES
jgi:hypothetical protein